MVRAALEVIGAIPEEYGEASRIKISGMISEHARHWQDEEAAAAGDGGGCSGLPPPPFSLTGAQGLVGLKREESGDGERERPMQHGKTPQQQEGAQQVGQVS